MQNDDLKFKILPHAADLKIRAFGKTKEELFSNAMLGMAAGLQPGQKAKNVKQKIKIESPDLNALLVDFLSEVLYLIQVNREIYDQARFTKFTDTEIEAELSGQKVESFGGDIKAVTHHGLDARQKENGIWETEVLFDI